MKTCGHEDLRVRTRVQNHALAKSLSAAAWRAFLALLTFQAARAGKRVQAVTPAFTSQTGSGGGVMVATGVSARWHACPECGTSLQRDHNAARTLQQLGPAHRRLGYRLQALTQPVGADVA